MTRPPYHYPLAAILALACGIVCIGFSAIFVKLAGVPGPVSAFYRVLIAGSVLVPWWLARREPLPAGPDLRLIIAGGIFFAVDIALWNSSLLLTSAATATLLANNSPLWVGLASWLLFRERLARRYWLGLALALCGMAWLMGGDALRNISLSSGNLLAVGASFFYAAFIMATRRARMRVPLMTYMGISAITSIAALLIINLVLGTALTGYSRTAWLALAAMGLFSQLCGWLAINYALGHLGAAPVSVSLLAQTVVTALVAMPVLGEYVHFHQVAGGVVILAGITCVILGTLKPTIPALEAQGDPHVPG